MYLLTVAPLKSGLPHGTLTYISKSDVSVGSFVYIKIGNKKTDGIVLSSESAREHRQHIKTSSYNIKHIEEVSELTPISHSIEHIYTSLTLEGTTCSDVFLDMLHLTPSHISNIWSNKERHRPTYIIEPSVSKRVETYIELLQKHSSLLIFVPSAGYADVLGSIMRKNGIEPIILHSSLTALQEKKARELLIESETRCIIATPASGAVYLTAFSHIVIEYYYSHLYTQDFSYTIHQNRILYTLIAETNKYLYISDSNILPDRETTKAYSDEKLKFTLIDMTEPLLRRNIFFCNDLLTHIEGDKTNKLVLFVNRKGLSPSLSCDDCHSTVLCTLCNKPVMLTIDEEGYNCTYCSSCKHTERYYEGKELMCNVCGSYKISTVGIATQNVVKELEKFGHSSLRFDSDCIKSHASAKKKMKEFYTGDINILIATEMCIPYLLPQAQNIAVLSIDALLFHKNHSTDLIIRDTIARLSSLSITRNILIQSRYKKLIHMILEGSHTNFVQRYQEDATMCGYPPSSYEFILQSKIIPKTILHSISHITSRVRTVYQHGVYTTHILIQNHGDAYILAESLIPLRKDLKLCIN